jgi:hypothetical protein
MGSFVPPALFEKLPQLNSFSPSSVSLKKLNGLSMHTKAEAEAGKRFRAIPRGVSKMTFSWKLFSLLLVHDSVHVKKVVIKKWRGDRTKVLITSMLNDFIC